MYFATLSGKKRINHKVHNDLHKEHHVKLCVHGAFIVTIVVKKNIIIITSAR